MNKNAAIVLEHVQKSFGKKQVLIDVTGSINYGKTIGLLGRNGDGKTTLFRIILDILATDRGLIQLEGQTPDGSGNIRRITGYVPERPVFHPFMTINDVFKFRKKIFPSWDDKVVSETAKTLELDLATSIQGASKGTLAKTAWICATAHKPKILLLDEPTSGLDIIVRDALLTQCIHQQSFEDRAIIISSHHLDDWLNLLDEIWVLSGGVIAARHDLDDLRENSLRITGMLKQQTLPQGLEIIEEFRNGNIVAWLTIDPETPQKIQALSVLDQIEIEPLPLQSTLKLLLQKEVTHVR
ncbi:MAG TPA: ABC transporter ATP-binding protein [Acidobacteriota bacterium]|nr:ABC transporter ATP-binding protein [Acidobacteriota bacterium]